MVIITQQGGLQPKTTQKV